MKELSIRKANPSDIAFLSKVIFWADQSGTNKSSYCTLFNMNEFEFCSLCTQLFDLELEHCEFDINSFCVAEIDGESIGACAAWVEGFDNIPSWQIKFTGFKYALLPETLQYFLSIQNQISGILPVRSTGAIQIEAVYINPNYRGRGILKDMIEFQINCHSTSDIVEIITYDNNTAAIQAYTKLGFRLSKTTSGPLNAITDQYPSYGMKLLEKKTYE